MRATAKCKSCDAPIHWVLSASTGSRMPLDAKPNPEGNIWVDHWEGGSPVVVVASADNPPPANAVIFYTSHFVTCRDAAEHRRK